MMILAFFKLPNNISGINSKEEISVLYFLMLKLYLKFTDAINVGALCSNLYMWCIVIWF